MRHAWFLLLAGCMRPPAPVAHAPYAPVVPERPELLVIVVRTDPVRESRVLVELTLEGPLARTTQLRFSPAHDVVLSDPVAEDDLGPIAVDPKLTLARGGKGALRIRYSLAFGSGGKRDALAPEVESIELRAAGEDLLALPDLPDRVPVELTLRAGESDHAGGASSFALGNHQRFEARTAELRNAYYVAGDVGTATFHAADGDDFAAWIGPTAFDARWVSAEIAVTRSLVDIFVGRSHGPNSPPAAVLLSTAKRDDPPFFIAPRTRGLFVSADRRALWTSSARILAAQALVQRYIGGLLWVGARDPGAESAGWFFSEGFSRTIAREVLFDAGLIDAADRARELNHHLFLVAFAPDPRGVAAANGALLATALDVAARKNARSLREFVRERLGDAATKKVDLISLAEFTERARETAGAAFADTLTATLTRGAEVPLPADLLGRCWHLERRTLAPFELGFVTTAGQEMTVETVTPLSRAEAAGVRVGDVVASIDYKDGITAAPVHLTVKRGERTIPLSFLPRGSGKPGRMFERVPGIPDARCDAP